MRTEVVHKTVGVLNVCTRTWSVLPTLALLRCCNIASFPAWERGLVATCAWCPLLHQYNRQYSHKLLTINNYVNCPSNFAFARSYFTRRFLTFANTVYSVTWPAWVKFIRCVSAPTLLWLPFSLCTAAILWPVPRGGWTQRTARDQLVSFSVYLVSLGKRPCDYCVPKYSYSGKK